MMPSGEPAASRQTYFQSARDVEDLRAPTLREAQDPLSTSPTCRSWTGPSRGAGATSICRLRLRGPVRCAIELTLD